MSLEEERIRLMEMIAHLERRIDVHDGKLQALETVPGTLQSIDRRLWEGDQMMRAFRDDLGRNTEITKLIHETQIAGKVVQGVGKWLAALIIGAAAVIAAIKGMRL